MTPDERVAVVDIIAANPMLGVVIPGAGGLRKARISLSGRGKRGGGRVIYWFHSLECPVVLLWVFAKNEAEDLTPAQRQVLMQTSQTLLASFRR